MFRCVYCLDRETWSRGTTTFHIDHLVPVSSDQSVALVYDNLVYSCSTCNLAKQAVTGLPDPCATAFGSCLRVDADGAVEPLNDDGIKLVKVLCLNSRESVTWRKRMLALEKQIATLRDLDPKDLRNWMGFPEDLPNLNKLRPPSNTRPDGTASCFFIQRKLGTLPETY